MRLRGVIVSAVLGAPVVLVASIFAGCSLFVALDDLQSGADASDESANLPDGDEPSVILRDSGTDSGAQDAGACAPVAGNLIAGQNSDFELGCTGWGTFTNGASASDSTSAHCGAKACRLCATIQGTGGVLVSSSNQPAVLGETYSFRVFVRSAPGSTVSIAYDTLGDSDTLNNGSFVNPQDGWHQSVVTITPHGSDNLKYAVVLQTFDGDSGCIDIDDAVLLRTEDAGL